MPITADYLGMGLRLEDLDGENVAYFKHCAEHSFHLQQCADCKLLRYPPTTACPWCMSRESQWVPVEGRGTVHSYTEVHHAIQPAFRPFVPYLVLLVELDTQRGEPTEHEALRVVGNLVSPDGHLVGPDVVATVGIGSRVRMVLVPVADGLAIPNWTIDDDTEQPEHPWRCPE